MIKKLSFLHDFWKKYLHFLKFWQVRKCILINMNQFIPRKVPEIDLSDPILGSEKILCHR